jgi:hypothetical protein
MLVKTTQAFDQLQRTGRILGLAGGRLMADREKTVAGTESVREMLRTGQLQWPRRSRAWVVTCAIATLATSADPVRAQRDTARTARGTATIRGQVVAGDTNAPIRNAMVLLRPADMSGTGWIGLPASPAIRVDANGNFEFLGVATGRYRLIAEPGPSAARYLTGQYPDPASENALPLTVARDQVVEGIVIGLRRAAAIAGRVVDERGDPLAMVSVSVIESLPGERRRSPVLTQGREFRDRTDDTGAFRLFGLRPGEYILQAEPVRQAPIVVVDGTGSKHTVLLSEDPVRWHERASTTKLVIANMAGQYQMPGIRPGRYLLIATPREEASLSNTTPAFFELLAKHATPVVINEGEQKTLDLKVVSLRQ